MPSLPASRAGVTFLPVVLAQLLGRAEKKTHKVAWLVLIRHGRELERPRDGRSRFDEEPPPHDNDDGGKVLRDDTKEADGKPPRGRDNRWEGSDADRPLPGPPPPLQRREGVAFHLYNHSITIFYILAPARQGQIIAASSQKILYIPPCLGTFF